MDPSLLAWRLSLQIALEPHQWPDCSRLCVRPARCPWAGGDRGSVWDSPVTQDAPFSLKDAHKRKENFQCRTLGDFSCQMKNLVTELAAGWTWIWGQRSAAQGDEKPQGREPNTQMVSQPGTKGHRMKVLRITEFEARVFPGSWCVCPSLGGQHTGQGTRWGTRSHNAMLPHQIPDLSGRKFTQVVLVSTLEASGVSWMGDLTNGIFIRNKMNHVVIYSERNALSHSWCYRIESQGNIHGFSPSPLTPRHLMT